MRTALPLALLVCAAPVFAADPSPAPAAPAAASAANGGDANVPAKDQQPNPGSDGGVTPYALKDFDEVVKNDEKRMEADLKETLKQVDAQYQAQKDLESRQLKEKFEFLKKQRDERAAFERGEIEAWKKFVVTLKAVEPAERGAEKLQFDQKSMERRHKNDDEAVVRNREFIEKQQRERDAFWAEVQKQNNENSRLQQEHATQWGKTSKAP
jgi:hypothetical protein